MASTFTKLTRPSPGADYRLPVAHRKVGLAIGAVGVLLALVTLVANLVASARIGDGEEAGGILAWSFGLTTTAFGTVKFGIAVILIGILVRIWFRWQSMRETLPALKPAVTGDETPRYGDIDTAYGPATAGETAPGALPIHKMARTMWAPMLAMGAMAVLAGFFVSLAWSGNATGGESVTTAAAWTQGLQFLGEAFLLAGISFLLGSSLGLIREGGAETQESLGVVVKVLKMPATAKVFVALMATGLMLAVFQFIAYLVVAANGTAVAANFAWLGPIRELSLGLLLSGIVLALATIATALGFQASRVREIITTGR